jgi:thiamine monophosphate synthase
MVSMANVITIDNLPDVFEAGARNFCMVRPINQTNEPEKVLKEILKIYKAIGLY